MCFGSSNGSGKSLVPQKQHDGCDWIGSHDLPVSHTVLWVSLVVL